MTVKIPCGKKPEPLASETINDMVVHLEVQNRLMKKCLKAISKQTSCETTRNYAKDTLKTLEW